MSQQSGVIDAKAIWDAPDGEVSDEQAVVDARALWDAPDDPSGLAAAARKFGPSGSAEPESYARPPGTPTVGEMAKAAGGAFVEGAASAAGGVLKGMGLAAKAIDPLFPESWRSRGGLAAGGEAIQEAGSGLAAEERAKVAAQGGATKFLAETVPGALGSSVPLMAGGGVAGVGARGLGATVSGAAGVAGTAVGLQGAAAAASHGWDDAKVHGATDEDAWKSALINGGVGLTEAVPLAGVLGRLLRRMPRGAAEIVRTALLEGGEEVIQETVQQVAGNLAAQNLYDEDRKAFEGALENGGAGFLTGFLISALGGAGGNVASRRMGKGAATPEAVGMAPAGPSEIGSKQEDGTQLAPGEVPLESPTLPGMSTETGTSGNEREQAGTAPDRTEATDLTPEGAAAVDTLKAAWGAKDVKVYGPSTPEQTRLDGIAQKNGTRILWVDSGAPNARHAAYAEGHILIDANADESVSQEALLWHEMAHHAVATLAETGDTGAAERTWANIQALHPELTRDFLADYLGRHREAAQASGQGTGTLNRQERADEGVANVAEVLPGFLQFVLENPDKAQQFAARDVKGFQKLLDGFITAYNAVFGKVFGKAADMATRNLRALQASMQTAGERHVDPELALKAAIEINKLMEQSAAHRRAQPKGNQTYGPATTQTQTDAAKGLASEGHIPAGQSAAVPEEVATPEAPSTDAAEGAVPFLPNPDDAAALEADARVNSIAPQAVAVDEIGVDPKRFQFKSDTTSQEGVREKDVGDVTFDHRLADILLVWEDKAGKRWVVDGHHRLARAKRSGVGLVNAWVYREADGVTEAQARTLGATKNIAGGHGDAADAAKMIRELGWTEADLKAHGLNTKSGLGRNALGLAKLSDPVFAMVINKELPENYGQIIGRELSEPGEQMEAAKEAHKLKNEDEMASVVRQIKNAPKTTTTQSGMFGDETDTRSLLAERAQVETSIRRKLKGERGLFNTLAAKAGLAERVEGNTVNQAASEAEAAALDNLLDTINRLADLKGPVSDVLNQAAKRVSEGEAVGKSAAAAIKQLAETDIAWSPVNKGAGAASPDSEPAQDVRQKEVGQALFSVAYHGTPHEFDEFDTDKIGTGEGAQAYGHGLYFTDKKEIAEHYKKKLTGNEAFYKIAFDSSDEPLSAVQRAALDEAMNGTVSRAGAQAKLLSMRQYPPWSEVSSYEEISALWELIEKGKVRLSEKVRKGHTLQVDLAPADDEYLLWDKPLSEQSEKVHDAVATLLKPGKETGPNSTGAEIYALTAGKVTGRANAQPEASAALHAAGIRGIKYLDGSSRSKGEGAYNYVIFDAKDVKITARHAIRRKPRAANQLDLPTTTQLNTTLAIMQDFFKPVAQSVGDTGFLSALPVADSKDAALAEELWRGKAKERVEAVRHAYLDPILKRAARSKVALARIDDYLTVRHAPGYNAQIAKIDPKNALYRGSGMTDAEAATRMAAFKASPDIAHLEWIAAKVDAWVADELQYKIDRGLVSQEQADAYRAAYPEFWVPQRDMPEPEDQAMGFSGSGFQTRGKDIRRLGREIGHVADSPLSFLSFLSGQTAVAGERAEVGQRFLKMLRTYPLANLARIDEPQTKPGIVQTKAGQRVGTVRDPSYWSQPNVVIFREAGEPVTVEFMPGFESLAEAFKGLHPVNPTVFRKLIATMGAITRTLGKASVRWNPFFPPINVARDLGAVGFLGTAEHGAEFSKAALGGWLPAYRELRSMQGDRAKRSARVKLWQENGGPISFLDLAPDVREKAKSLEREIAAFDGKATSWEKISTLFEDTIGQWSDAMEQATRFSVFNAALDVLKLSPERAAALSKNMTLNFEKKGQIGSVVNSLYLFAGAGINGSVRIALAGARNARVRKGMLALVAFGALLDALGTVMGGDDGDDVPNWDAERIRFDKRTNAVLLLPDGHRVKLPMPYGLSWFVHLGETLSAFTRHQFDANTGRDAGQAVGDIFSSFFDSFNPFGGSGPAAQLVAPTPLDPFVQVWTNKTWTGSKQRPDERFKDQPESARAWEDTNQSLKDFARWLNRMSGGTDARPGLLDVSPETIKLFAQTITGGLGSEIMRAGGVAMEPSSVGFDKIPLVRRIVGSPPAESRWEFKFRDVAGEIDRDFIETKGKETDAATDNADWRRLKNGVKRDVGKLKDDFDEETDPESAAELQRQMLEIQRQFVIDYRKRNK